VIENLLSPDFVALPLLAARLDAQRAVVYRKQQMCMASQIVRGCCAMARFPTSFKSLVRVTNYLGVHWMLQPSFPARQNIYDILRSNKSTAFLRAHLRSYFAQQAQQAQHGPPHLNQHVETRLVSPVSRWASQSARWAPLTM
jgi:hypothetical protein